MTPIPPRPTRSVPISRRHWIQSAGWLLSSGLYGSQRLFGQEASQPLDGYELNFPTMGTLFSMQAFARSQTEADAGFQEARREVERLASIFTDYDPESETSKLSDSAGTNRFIEVSPELWDLLEHCDRWYRISGGTFDASLGSLTSLWRKSRRQKKTLDRKQVESALLSSGWKHVELDPANRKVRIDQPGLRLDFGAIAKGYCVDRAFGILRAHSLHATLVNASGNMRCGSPPPDRDGWRLEIAPLLKGEPPLRTISLTDASISTSGDLWQYTQWEGKRRSHILDPRTGIGIEGPISVTVLADTATDADAASTAISVHGHQAGAELAMNTQSIEALITSRIDSEAVIRYTVTPGFATYHHDR